MKELTEHTKWHLLIKSRYRTHLWLYDLHCLISQSEVWKLVCTFPRQLWSEPLRKWSSGVCTGNFVLIVKTNTLQPVLCSPWVTVSTTAAGSILLSNTGRQWGEKHHELVSVERERGHLVLLIVTDPWQWTERSLCELPFISTTLPYAPQPPTSLHPSILWNMYKANRGGVDAQTFLLYD